MAIEESCLDRERLLNVASDSIGPIWPDISKPAPRVDNRIDDAVVLVALEGDARGPIRIGANGTAQAWSSYFTQTLGIPDKHLHQVAFSGIGRKSFQAELDAAAKQVGQGGRLWLLFIGRGRVGCSSSNPTGAHCAPQLWLELASAEQDTPEPHEWAFAELQDYVGRRSSAPVIVVDVVASMPDQTDGGANSRMPPLPPPSRGVTLALVHPFQPTAKASMTDAIAPKFLQVGDRLTDITRPLLLAGAGVLPGTAEPAFSRLLLAALRGWAVRNADGRISAEGAVRRIRDALASAAPSLSGVPEAVGPDRGKRLVPAAELDSSSPQAPAPRVIGGHSILFNPASRVLSAKAGPTASEIDWHMFDDIGDTSRLTTGPRPYVFTPNDFYDNRREYEALARPIGKNLKESYGKYTDAQLNMRIASWCGAATAARLAPFRHEAWRHCASFVSFASMQLLVGAELENDWRRLEELLRVDAIQPTDGLALLRHMIERYPMLNHLDPLDARERTCQRIVRRRGKSPDSSAAPDGHEWVFVPGAVLANVMVQAAFEIQRTEVTNAQYERCVKSGACRQVVRDVHWTEDAEVDPRNGAQALVGVTWDEGRAFCRWLGGDLPTIAEWSHAARASEAASVDAFAWAHGRDRCAAAVIAAASQYAKCRPQPKGPTEVCSRPQSNSPLGLCDMVGNVSEWVRDAALGVSSGGKNQTAMGHNWANGRIDESTDMLPLFSPVLRTSRSSAVGFRCMRPAR